MSTIAKHKRTYGLRNMNNVTNETFLGKTGAYRQRPSDVRGSGLASSNARAPVSTLGAWVLFSAGYFLRRHGILACQW